ncbi:EF-hand calcium-binding domain-containing protein 10 [Thoreauomyces humboldtii]|nr:EF-hand calcium-binding domain-containing protein 10 [Thoreauomyces humboldtii]
MLVGQTPPAGVKSLPPTESVQARDATAYLEKNRVPQIIQQLLCAVLYERPDDPKEYMVRKLEETRNAKARGQALLLFTRENLTALFRIFDVTGKGSITKEQYDEGTGMSSPTLVSIALGLNQSLSKGMRTIGALDKASTRPSGVEHDIIRSDTFVEEALAALSKL